MWISANWTAPFVNSGREVSSNGGSNSLGISNSSAGGCCWTLSLENFGSRSSGIWISPNWIGSSVNIGRKVSSEEGSTLAATCPPGWCCWRSSWKKSWTLSNWTAPFTSFGCRVSWEEASTSSAACTVATGRSCWRFSSGEETESWRTRTTLGWSSFSISTWCWMEIGSTSEGLVSSNGLISESSSLNPPWRVDSITRGSFTSSCSIPAGSGVDVIRSPQMRPLELVLGLSVGGFSLRLDATVDVVRWVASGRQVAPDVGPDVGQRTTELKSQMDNCWLKSVPIGHMKRSWRPSSWHM